MTLETSTDEPGLPPTGKTRWGERGITVSDRAIPPMPNSVKSVGFGQLPGRVFVNHGDDEITQLLHRVRSGGDSEAQRTLMDAVYPELHRIAARIFSSERTGHSLEPTALIADVWLRILRDASIDWQSRTHFYRVAARTMRHVLVDYARSKNAQRRPNRHDRLPLDDVVVCSDDRLDEILDVHDALERLGVQNAGAADVVELRYYGGYKLEEIAAILKVSLTTVKNKHEFAMSWLEAFLNGAALD
jgi:RNA polymerase sigma-70 factor (ECF subfamily)